MADTARIADLLDSLDGIDALREHLESLIRDHVSELLVNPRQGLVRELDRKDHTLSHGDRQLLARVKQRLAEAIPTAQAVEDASNAVGEVVRNAVAKAQRPLSDLAA
jgi:hypothetical protein